MGKLTGEKECKCVESGRRHHFIIGLVIYLGSKTVHMEIANKASLPGFGSIATVCAGRTGAWKGQRFCLQLSRYRCSHSSLKAGSSGGYSIECAKSRVC